MEGGASPGEEGTHDVSPEFSVKPAGAAVTAQASTIHAATRPAGMAVGTLPSMFAAWLSLTYPPLLPLALAPAAIVLAYLWARGVHISAALAGATLVALLAIQGGAAALAAYYDARQPSLPAGDDAERRPLLVRTGIYPLAAMRMGVTLLALGALIGAVVTVSGGPIAVVLALVGLALGVAYSVPPVALRRTVLGDLAVLVTLGPAIAIVVALSQTHTVSDGAVLLGCIAGVLALAIALAAHLRDGDIDGNGVKPRSLVSLLGTRGTAMLCAACIAASYVLLVLFALPLGAPHGALLAVLTLPDASLALTGVMRAQPGTPRALVVRQMVRLYTLFAVWLLVGLVATGVVVRLLVP